jgi:hypothetical protein
MPQDLLKSMKKNDLPTQEDSLALYNNSKKVQEYYKKYKNLVNSYNTKENNPAKFFNSLDNAFNHFKRINQSGIVVPSTKDNNYQDVAANMPESIYRKNIDKNKFLQRERSNYILDTRAPMQLYDKRIVPTQKSDFENKNRNDVMYGDIVDIDTYDPILIKPVNMLTPEEKIIRQKRYGKDSGLPQPSTPLSLMKKPEVVVQKQNNYDEGESIMLPIPAKLGGGGSAFIGVKNKDGSVEYVKPEDFKRMGVPPYGQEFILNQLAKEKK